MIEIDEAHFATAFYSRYDGKRWLYMKGRREYLGVWEQLYAQMMGWA